jgi:hypothetical protein
MPNGAVLLRIVAKMRADTTELYKLLMVVFAPGVVTKNHLNSGIMSGKSWSSLVTVSDEAFVLLVLLNSWNTWVTDALKINNEAYPMDATVWSTAGKGKNWRKFLGWSRDGVLRYAQLFRAVKADRINQARSDLFDEQMRDAIIKTMSKKHQNQLKNKYGGTNDNEGGTATEKTVESDLIDIMNDID